MKEEAKDKRISVESEIKDDLEKVSDEVVDFLDKRYPISMNLLRNIFGREGEKNNGIGTIEYNERSAANKK